MDIINDLSSLRPRSESALLLTLRPFLTLLIESFFQIKKASSSCTIVFNDESKMEFATWNYTEISLCVIVFDIICAMNGLDYCSIFIVFFLLRPIFRRENRIIDCFEIF